MAELDPDVIEVAKAHFGRVHRGAFDDPRLKVTVGDGLAYLRATGVRYDLVAMDLTDPVGPSAELYYAGDLRARPAGDGRRRGPGPAPRLAVLACRARARRRSRTCARSSASWRPISCTSRSTARSGASRAPPTRSIRAVLEPAEADRRIAARGVGDLQYYNGETHRAVFALPNYVRRLVA